MSRLPTKSVMVHLQRTQDDCGRDVLYAEAFTSTGQRCSVTGPYVQDTEATCISDILAHAGVVLSERVTFGTQPVGDKLINVL